MLVWWYGGMVVWYVGTVWYGEAGTGMPVYRGKEGKLEQVGGGLAASTPCQPMEDTPGLPHAILEYWGIPLVTETT